MLGYFKKKTEEVLDDLLKPLWAWLKKASWATKAVFLLVVSAALYFIGHPDRARDITEYSWAFIRVASTDKTTIPIRKSIADETNHLVARLQRTHPREKDLEVKDDDPALVPWSIAQVHLAILGLDSSVKAEKVAARLRRDLDKSCACWREVPTAESGKPRNVFISGWMLALFSELGVPAEDEEIAFLLQEQLPDGSWSIYPVNPGSKHASPYATAWAVKGLNAQRSTYHGQLRARIDAAIERGTAWLMQHQTSPARWIDYPLVPKRPVSLSISGVALHALHAASPQSTAGLDREWLDNLPDPMPADRAEQPSDVYVQTRQEGLQQDVFTQIVLPWVLVATADAFPNGSVTQRARALVFLERAMKQKSVQAADGTSANWWRAELLYGIRYVMNRTRPS